MNFETSLKLTKYTDLCLKISQEIKDKAWNESENLVSDSIRWQAYLNRLCLDILLPIISEKFIDRAHIEPDETNWEIVNCTAINLQNKRLIIIPSDAFDIEELRVPQEWIDIPSWAGDYYLAAQVDTEENLVRFWGFTTHKKLKERGDYDSRDRTFSLEQTDLIEDLNVLWTTLKNCPNEQTKSEIKPLNPIPEAQANNLLLRLGNPKQAFTRRTIPFEMWGALLENRQWKKQLFKLINNISEERSIRQWLQNGIADLARQIGWQTLQFQTEGVVSMGEENAITSIAFSRQLTIAGQPYQLRLQPTTDLNTWQFSLHSLALGGLIPGGFKLRLLTEQLQPFPDNECIAISSIDRLEIEVTLDPGDGLIWEIEPIPDNYQREILRF